MVYRRFKLHEYLATLATAATVRDGPAETVADVATVAGPSGENRDSISQSFADVATVAGLCAEAELSDPSAASTDIAIALERIAAELRLKGCPPEAVSARALTLVRADLRNSATFFIRQTDPNRCLVCGERESQDRPFIPVLSAKPDSPHWLHLGCHAEHVRRVEARVEAAIRDAAKADRSVHCDCHTDLGPAEHVARKMNAFEQLAR